MLASRQLLGLARGRAAASASLGLRRMATVSDSPLDKKVSAQLATGGALSPAWSTALLPRPLTGTMAN